MDKLQIILKNLQDRAEDKDFTFKRLYRLFYNKDLYYKALAKLYSNQGIATPGVDGETVDGINEEKIDRIIETLRDESYQPKPAKRVYIPKKHSQKKRPLGLPSFSDKLVQEVLRLILNIIYEPLFSNKSHGFRENRSCHTALLQIEKTFTGVNWFIEGDVRGCFDNIDHHVLIKILRKKIKDERFINLIWKFLKAGYLEDWQYHKTYSGCPQGGIVSPILANIYLNELDNFIEEVIIPKYNKGKKTDRKINPEYQKITNRRRYLKQKINRTEDEQLKESLKQEYKDLTTEMLKLPYYLPNQGEFRKVLYCRYADDWLIGVIGSKEDCRNIKNEIQEFLEKELKIELSEEKTLITHSDKPAKFLSYDISVRRNQSYKKVKGKYHRRVRNKKVVLKIPKNKLQDFIVDKRLVKDIKAKKWKPIPRLKFIDLSDREIVDIYNSEIRGFYNYYSLAENVSKILNNLHYVMEYSCLKTLAAKHRTSIGKFKDTHRQGKDWGIPYTTKEGPKFRTFYKGFKRKRTPDLGNPDEMPNNQKYLGDTSDFEKRIRADKCELCGKENVPLECHHVHKLKDLKGKAKWIKVMRAKKRKTLMVCHECHWEIHNGTFDRNV